MSTPLRPHAGFRAFVRLTQQLGDRFQRSRVWCPRSVMVWLMLLVQPGRKVGYRSALDGLVTFGRRHFGWQSKPSVASITMARRKLSGDMCRKLLTTLVDEIDGLLPDVGRFAGRRLIAFDGTRLITRHSADTVTKLVRYPRPNGELVHNPQALMVMALDVERRLPLGWVIAGKGKGETAALEELLDQLAIGPGDVAILDRGYTSKALYAALVARGADVVIRMKTAEKNCWTEVREFIKSGKKNADITVHLRKTQGGPATLKGRLVERNLKPGRAKAGTKKERMVILTTLPESQGFDRKTILSMYASRWGIESLFAELKSFMHVEPFHGTTVDMCEQEIAAALIWMALASYMQAVAESDNDGKRVYRTDCLRYANDVLRELLEGRDFIARMDDAIDSLQRYSSYRTRSGRSAPRECKMPFGRSIQRGRVK